MNITYLTIILLTIFVFTIHNRNTNREFFKTDFNKTLKKIKNSINLVNMKYIAVSFMSLEKSFGSNGRARKVIQTIPIPHITP